MHAYAPFVRLDPERATILSTLSGATVASELPPAVVARLSEQPHAMAAFAQRFDSAVSACLPVLLVAIVAASASLLALLFRRRAALTHIVFALHWAAFYFTLEALRRLLPLPADWALASEKVLIALALVYVATAMATVYGERPLAAAWKAAALILLFTALLAGWFWSATTLATAWA